MLHQPHQRPIRHLLGRLAGLLGIVFVIIFAGGAFYQWLDSTPAHTSSYTDAVYDVVMIVTAIGGDKPQTTAGKVFMCVFALVSVGLIVSVLAHIFRYISARSMHEIAAGIHDRKVKRMSGHIILCGFSYTLNELIAQMPHRQRLWIIVRTEEQAKRIEHAHTDVHAHVEDFTRAETLRHAGIDAASCIVACGEDDAENAFLCLSAKHLRKDIRVIVRLSRSENREQLKAAGADEIINPAELAAKEMCAALVSVNP